MQCIVVTFLYAVCALTYTVTRVPEVLGLEMPSVSIAPIPNYEIGFFFPQGYIFRQSCKYRKEYTNNMPAASAAIGSHKIALTEGDETMHLIGTRTAGEPSTSGKVHSTRSHYSKLNCTLRFSATFGDASTPSDTGYTSTEPFGGTKRLLPKMYLQATPW